MKRTGIKHVNKLEDGRPQYRLGDAVLLRDTYGGRQVLETVAAHPRFFSDTVLFEYAGRINRDDPAPQWGVLTAAVLNYVWREELALPKDDELVVHLRMGDTKGYKGSAATFAAYLSGLVNECDCFSQITLVTALHFGALDKTRVSPEALATAENEETEKIEKILELLGSTGVAVKLHSHVEIDRDFCYLANARYMVLGNGLFSLCAAMISEAQPFVPPWIFTGSPVGNRLLQTTIRPMEEEKRLGRAADLRSHKPKVVPGQIQ